MKTFALVNFCNISTVFYLFNRFLDACNEKIMHLYTPRKSTQQHTVPPGFRTKMHDDD